jgi:integrase
MANYCVKRDGLWRFVRRVPKEYAALDKRRIIQHSTGISIAEDPRGIRAKKVANELNFDLETYWRNLADGHSEQAVRDYEAAKHAARRLRISEPIADAAKRTIAELLERIEKLEGNLAKDRSAVLAVFDAAPQPGITFRRCAEQYIESHKPSWSNPKHAAQWSATLETYAYPVLGNIAVDKISNGDGTDLVMKVLQPIWHTRTETASRLRGRIESVLDWSKARGYREGENPARWRGHLDKLLPGKRKIAPVKHHPAMPYIDIPGFMKRLRKIEGNAARALEFTVLTAGRTSETLMAKRSEIDLKARMWTVPAGRMKKRKEHRVPLCDRAVAIIKATSGDYLFPGTRPGRPLSKDAMSELLKTMGISPNDVTTHGFRSTFTDWAAETTHYPKELRDLATAHKIGDQVEAAYRRGDMLAKRHALMRDWERYCNGEPGGEAP